MCSGCAGAADRVRHSGRNGYWRSFAWGDAFDALAAILKPF
jgi:hypothetical protein